MRTIIAFLLLCSPAFAQTTSIGQVFLPNDNRASCVIVRDLGPSQHENWRNALAATGYHCTVDLDVHPDPSQAPRIAKLRVRFSDGKSATAVTVDDQNHPLPFNMHSDGALIRLVIPESATVARLGSITKKAYILGNDWGREGVAGRFDGVYLRELNNLYCLDMFARKGCSGGGLFNARDELCGLLSGGYMHVHHDSNGRFEVWPTLCCPGPVIEQLLAEYDRNN